MPNIQLQNELREILSQWSKQNYYQILGIQQEQFANLDEENKCTNIEKAYKELSKLYHPDKLTGAEDQATACFQLIGTAKETLTDINKRNKYDEALLATPNPMANNIVQPTENWPEEYVEFNAQVNSQAIPKWWLGKGFGFWEEDYKCCHEASAADDISVLAYTYNNRLDRQFHTYRINQYNAFLRVADAAYAEYTKSKIKGFKEYSDSVCQQYADRYQQYAAQQAIFHEQETKKIATEINKKISGANTRKVVGYIFYVFGGFLLVKSAKKAISAAQDEKAKRLLNLQQQQLDEEGWKKENPPKFLSLQEWSKKHGYDNCEDFIAYNRELITEDGLGTPTPEWSEPRKIEQQTAKMQSAVIHAKNHNAQIANINQMQPMQRRSLGIEQKIDPKYLIRDLDQLMYVTEMVPKPAPRATQSDQDNVQDQGLSLTRVPSSTATC